MLNETFSVISKQRALFLSIRVLGVDSGKKVPLGKIGEGRLFAAF